jgi:AcrR family transcriptional regulator
MISAERAGRMRVTPPASGSRRERRKQITRSELIWAGRKLFSARGLYEVRIEDLATEAGIAKGTVYLYFRGKVGLIQAVVAEGLAGLADRVRSRTAHAATLAEYVERAAEAHFEFFLEHPDLMRILHQGRGMLTFRHPQSRPLRAPLRRHINFLSTELARVRGRGARISSRDREIAIAVFGCASGVASTHVALHLGAAPSVISHLPPALGRMATRIFRGRTAPSRR